MSRTDHLQARFPTLGERLPRVELTRLPTPLRELELELPSGTRRVVVKQDDVSAALYGGNKTRKLEYLLARAQERKCDRIATFGAAGSNHALATALHARRLGLSCTCFLSHQRKCEGIAKTLRLHLENGTDIVRYGGSRATRIHTLREHLRGRRAWVIPMGGTCWLGNIGTVNAGLELAGQIDAREIRAPDRVYIATGTMGTAVGIALGLALVGLPIEVHAVRVSHTSITNETALRRVAEKTVQMMHRLDDTVPADTAGRMRLQLRHEFFGEGYAHSTPATDRALRIAEEQLGLAPETTYTGKAMAALLHDLESDADARVLFWNSYNSVPLELSGNPDTGALPEEFLRYLD